MICKDALGNNILLGKKYGYSRTDRVVIGVAQRTTAGGKVTLSQLQVQEYMYGEPRRALTYINKETGERAYTFSDKPTPPGFEPLHAETISIYSHLVFPVAADATLG